MYACGVTTYDDAHIGHGRQAIFFDVARRYLERCGFKVRYARNFTDIDDKIILRAAKQGVDPLELSQHYVRETARDLASLKVTPATYEPKVSGHIADIVSFIGRLIECGAAYVAEGDVLFDVNKFADYGKLSNRRPDDMKSMEDLSHKRNPQDFSLWKATKPGEPSWESPWGLGRPGWHIECSVLAYIYLGEQIDIHGGGLDLIFPHHENEIAQSESFTGKKFAQYWLHNGLVMVDGKKMSKSLGNFVTIKSALENHDAESIRFAILSVHYSSPMDFTDDTFHEAELRLYYFYRTLEIIGRLAKPGEIRDDNVYKKIADTMIGSFDDAMDDNLNTAVALSHLSDAFRKLNGLLWSKAVSAEDKAFGAAYFIDALAKISRVLGIFDELPMDYLERVRSRYVKSRGDIDIGWIEGKISERNKAKVANDFAMADTIRCELDAEGITLHDTETGTSWDPSFSISQIRPREDG